MTRLLRRGRRRGSGTTSDPASGTHTDAAESYKGIDNGSVWVYDSGMSNPELCGTAAGYNKFGTAHRQACSACREAATKWARGFQKAVAGGYREQWVKQNPPKSVYA